MYYKKFFLLLCILFGFVYISLSQLTKEQSAKNIDTVKLDITRNVIGFVPSNASKINGLAVGYTVLLDHDSIKINGLYTNLSPVQLLMSAFMIPRFIGILLGGKENMVRTNNKTIYGEFIEKDTTKHIQLINGASISIIELATSTKINGLEFSVVGQQTFQNNGLSISGLNNTKVMFNGVMLGLVNVSKKGNGFQLGLINNCGDLQGVQIGLINICGDRKVPLINFRFRKNTK